MTEPLFIHVSGTPEARGRRYGALARERILKNLAFYADMFEKGWGVPWAKAAMLAQSFIPHIEAHFPEGLLEMRGIAEGAGVAFEDILTLNCRSEILFAQPDGCSVFGVLPERSENGHTWLAQTWDWLRPAGDATVVLRIDQVQKSEEGKEGEEGGEGEEPEADGRSAQSAQSAHPDRPSLLMVVEAGMIGGKGMNSAGIGVCLNATSVGRGRTGMPLHVLYRMILNAPTVSNAFEAVARARRAGAGTFNLGSAEGFLMSVEFTPDAVDVLMAEDEPLTHTNHYLSPLFRGEDALKSELGCTWVRLNRLRRLGRLHPEGFGRDSILEVLSDHANHPDSICSHEDPADPEFRRMVTVYAMVMDLTERRMWVTEGNPCEGKVRAYGFE